MAANKTWSANLVSSFVSPKAKGSKNKRKIVDPAETMASTPASTPAKCPSNGTSSENVSDPVSNVGFSQSKLAAEETLDGDWVEPIAAQLEPLLSSNLQMVFQCAIKQVVDDGYNQNIARLTVSRYGLYQQGEDDLVSKTVSDTLSLLKRERKFDCSRDFVFEELQQLVEYTLVEMMNVLMEVKPWLSTSEAMWLLLLCDMDIAQACTADPLIGLGSKNDIVADDASSGSTAATQPKPAVESSNTKPSKAKEQGNMKKPLPCDVIAEALAFGSFPSLENSSRSTTLAPKGQQTQGSLHQSLVGTLGAAVQTTTSQVHLPQGKVRTSRKVLSKKELVACQKSLRSMDRALKNSGKLSLRSGSITAVSGIIVEKTMKPPSASSSMNGVASSKTNSVGEGPQAAGGDPSPTNSGSTDDQLKVSASAEQNGTKSAASAERVAPITPKKLPAEYCTGIPFDKSLGKYIPRDKKDELTLKLVKRLEGLQNEVQSWIEWANEKVLQAAQRLSKDMHDLRVLRQEKEEAEQLAKDSKVLEENALKRVAEMDMAVVNSTDQIEKANAAINGLEAQRKLLKKYMEAAKLQASESAARCQNAFEREQKAMKDSQCWERERIFLQEELQTHKQKVAEVQTLVDKAKNVQNQIEKQWKQERTEKEKILAHVASMRMELQRLEDAGQAEQDMIKQKAERRLNKYIVDIKELEKEISELQLKNDASRIESLRRGAEANKDGSSDEKGNVGGLRRERECVMCLSEEMSVVFLPCAHQVLCLKCSDLHENHGMVDCPACRTPIQQRVRARFGRR
ncbi:unnamed protein product [Linum trigynum]|uniref:RING-type domain-containing protein n=1 Tax=Linum trigynum TaxID=586398 RepID=A0AAV2D0B8_9ROSI